MGPPSRSTSAIRHHAYYGGPARLGKPVRAARLADMLGVSRSQVTRWLQGAGIDPLNAEKVDLLEMVWSSALRL